MLPPALSGDAKSSDVLHQLTASIAASSGSTAAAFPLPALEAFRFGIDLQQVNTTRDTTDTRSVMKVDASAKNTGVINTSIEDFEASKVAGALMNGSAHSVVNNADTCLLFKRTHLQSVRLETRDAKPVHEKLTTRLRTARTPASKR
jgi:hypothetical protein